MAKLRAVSDDEKPAKPKSLIEAVNGGSYREILIAQRTEIAKAIPDEKGPAKAALHRQLSLISKELAAMDAGNGDDEVGHAASTPDDDWDASAI